MAFHQRNVRPLYLGGGQWNQNFRFVVDAGTYAKSYCDTKPQTGSISVVDLTC